MGKSKDNLGGAVKTGIVWLIAERGAVQFLNVLSSVVLARLLTPNDFGIAGVAALFTGLSSRLSKHGFGMAIVQRRDLRPDHVSTLFVTAIVMNGLTYGALVGISPLVGAYYGNPLIASVLSVSALNFLVRCVGVCPSALLRRQMNFRAITIGSIADYAVNIVVSAVLAWNGWGVWSLVYGGLAGGFTDKVVMLVAARWRPSLRASRRAFSELFGFGMGVSLKSTFTYCTDNVDNFIVSKWLGTAALGLYEKAFRLMDLPVKEMSARMVGVLFPAFARMQHDPERFRAAFRKILLAVALVGYPVFGTLIVLAPAIVHVMYGPRWSATVVPFQILCLAAVPRMMSHVIGSALNAAGAIGAEVKRRGVLMVVLALGALAGTRWGLPGVAAAVVVVNVLSVTTITAVLRRVCHIPASDLVRAQWIPATGAVVLMVVEYASHEALVHRLHTPVFVALLLSAVAGGAAYLGALLMLRDEALNALVAELVEDTRSVARFLPWNGKARRRYVAAGSQTS
jgi:PST family polysaccharide transporter